MSEDPGKSFVAAVPWGVREDEILRKVRSRATVLMWLGYSVYAGCCLGAFLAFGEKPVTGLVIMVVQFLLVIWMGTKAMYQNMSSMFQLQLAANRETMPVFERLAAAIEKIEKGDHPTAKKVEEAAADAVEHLKAIRDSIERQTKPVTPNRRAEAATVKAS